MFRVTCNQLMPATRTYFTFINCKYNSVNNNTVNNIRTNYENEYFIIIIYYL